MRRITRRTLEKTLANHKHWLNRDCNGWESMRADLSEKELTNLDLSEALLDYAILNDSCLVLCNLHKANLKAANLRGAILRYADLSMADLSNADLSNDKLSGANLFKANLSGANLSNADLRGAVLFGANLLNANLAGANLSGANLLNANLAGANFYGTYLDCANLAGANIPYACPESGSFTGYKQANGYIVKLEIPEDAKRSSATTKKCRCSKAKVIDIETIDGQTACIKEIASNRDKTFIYKVGETVEVDNFDENRWNECAPGIHFFVNRDDAVQYVFISMSYVPSTKGGTNK